MSRSSTHAHYDEALRRAIMAEAWRRLVGESSDKLGLRPLAMSQGTSTTAIYTMFGGKAGLLAAVASEADQHFATTMRKSLRHDSVESDMRALCRTYRSWAMEHRGLYGLLMSQQRAHSGRDADVSRAPQWMEPLLEVVDALVDEGVFRSGDVHEITQSIWASLHGIVSLEMGVWHDSPSAEQYFETQVAAICRSWADGGTELVTADLAG